MTPDRVSWIELYFRPNLDLPDGAKLFYGLLPAGALSIQFDPPITTEPIAPCGPFGFGLIVGESKLAVQVQFHDNLVLSLPKEWILERAYVIPVSLPDVKAPPRKSGVQKR